LNHDGLEELQIFSLAVFEAFVVQVFKLGFGLLLLRGAGALSRGGLL